jgi:branched-chain amino acid transport system permease protein
MEAIILQGLNGLTAAMYIWLVAAGLTIAFGVLGVLNLAHGSLYMLGGFFAFTFFYNSCHYRCGYLRFPDGEVLSTPYLR